MRHSTVELTLGTYGHLAPGQEIDAVVQLGRVLAVSLDALKATGTDDEAAEASKGRAEGRIERPEPDTVVQRAEASLGRSLARMRAQSSEYY